MVVVAGEPVTALPFAVQEQLPVRVGFGTTAAEGVVLSLGVLAMTTFL